MFQELSTSTFSGFLCSSTHLDVFYYKTAALSTESMSCLLLLDSCFEPGEHELSELSSSSWQLLWARRAGAVFYFLTSALSKESKVSRSCLRSIQQEMSTTFLAALLTVPCRAGDVSCLPSIHQKVSAPRITESRRCCLLSKRIPQSFDCRKEQVLPSWQYFSQLNCWNCVLWWPLPLGQPPCRLSET